MSKLKKEKSITKLTKELDKWFSLYVRLSNAYKDGLVHCYTCTSVSHYKKIHAGHYISRYYKATRWDERNVRPQCFMCNIFRKGNAVIFRRNLVNEIGDVAVEEMEKSVDVLLRGGFKVDFFLEKIVFYKGKVDNLLDKKNN